MTYKVTSNSFILLRSQIFTLAEITCKFWISPFCINWLQSCSNAKPIISLDSAPHKTFFFILNISQIVIGEYIALFYKSHSCSHSCSQSAQHNPHVSLCAFNLMAFLNPVPDSLTFSSVSAETPRAASCADGVTEP